MNKISKILMVSLLSGACLFAAAACSPGDDGNVPAGSKVFTFEAEYVDCSGLDNTPGFSGGGSGTDIVAADTNGLGASNDFYTTCLYANGVTLEFVINSDRAVSDATLVARLSAEGGRDFSVSTSNYKITVNGTEINYSPIQFRNVPPVGDALAFRDYTLMRNVSLQEGENVIRLITSNNTSLGGTTEATAPMVDCIKITTSAELDWTPVESNLDNF